MIMLISLFAVVPSIPMLCLGVPHLAPVGALAVVFLNGG